MTANLRPRRESGAPVETAGDAQCASATRVAVRLAGVTKRFEDVTAVCDVDLSIADGEFFSLLGPSGCGKTTTLRMIAGLEFPTSGALEIFGEEMGLRPPDKRPVNTVFQSYALFPHMSVADNVAFGLEMTGVPRAEIRRRVGEVLDLVRLDGLEGRRPKQLSGGQQQRVALARALVNRPKVLLLDEPLGALDLKLRKAMQTELKAIQEQVGITFVYVTHDQEEALVMSDRIGVMDDGRLLQVGVPEEVYDHPRSRMVADFIGETNFLSAIVKGPGSVVLPTGEEVAVPADRAAAAGLGDWARDDEVVLALRPEKLRVLAAGSQAPSADNRLAGTVRRRVFLGSAVSYEVEAGPVTLRARQGNSHGIPRFSEGDDVVVAWDPSSSEIVVR